LESKNINYTKALLLTKFCLVFCLLSTKLTHPIHTCISKIWIANKTVKLEHIIPTEDLLSDPNINWSINTRQPFEKNQLTDSLKTLLSHYLNDNFTLTINDKNIPLSLKKIRVDVFETTIFLAGESPKKVKKVNIYNSLNMFLEGVENTTLLEINNSKYSTYHSNMVKSQNIKLIK